ncbi:15438_t:CDS:2 [Entrophospora sp. SA101]|nr:15438_t:CDS:2 [Entrophospora sp. SA101]CAJ0856284.1 16707_t:CDS:2 [Entrophospora sp. SA101]
MLYVKVINNVLLLNCNKSTTTTFLKPNVVASTRWLLPKPSLIPPRKNLYHFHTNLTGYNKFNKNQAVNLRQFSNNCIIRNETTDNSIKLETSTSAVGDINNNDPNVPSSSSSPAAATTKETLESIKEKVIKLSKEEKLDDAIKLVSSKENPGLENAEAWNQLIIECVDKGKTKMSIRLFNEMKKLSMLPTQETYTAILKEIGHVNCLLTICQRAKNFDVALKTYDDLIRSGKLKPNRKTYLQILKMCSANGVRQSEKAYELATDVWNKLVKDDQNKDNPNAVVVDDGLINGVIAAFKFTNHIPEAFVIVDDFYGIGKSAIAAEGESTKDDSHSLRLSITNDTVDSIFGLCFKTRQFDLGIEYYNKITAKYPDFSLDINNYDGLISLYNLNYQFNKTIETYHNQFKKFKLALNASTFESLMFACQNLRDLSTAKEILENAVEKQIALKPTGLTKILRLVLEQARTTENYNDVCWLLNKIDKTGDIYFNKEKKGIILIDDMDDKQLLYALSSAYRIALQEVKDLEEEKRAQWVEDKKIKKIYQGRWKTQDDKNWYNNPDNQFPLAPPNVNRRYNNNYYNGGPFLTANNNPSTPQFHAEGYYSPRSPPSYKTPIQSYGSFSGQHNRRSGVYRGPPPY